MENDYNPFRPSREQNALHIFFHFDIQLSNKALHSEPFENGMSHGLRKTRSPFSVN